MSQPYRNKNHKFRKAYGCKTILDKNIKGNQKYDINGT